MRNTDNHTAVDAGERPFDQQSVTSLQRSTADGQGALIFVHMFKSGGNTLNRILDWEYNPLRIFSVNGRYCRWSYRKLTECPAGMLAGMQVFRGHMPFGLHRFLPQPWTYITLQRNPIQRTISGYFARVNRVYYPDHRKTKKLTFEEYLRTLAHNNSQTKMIAGLNKSADFLAGECTEETLAVAKDNLRKYFSLVGITERFEETLALAKIKFGWKIEHYGSFNITQGRPKAMAPEALALVAEYNRFDVQLYQYAVSLFEEAIARDADGIRGEIEAVRGARMTKSGRVTYYRTASTALKMLTLGTSTVRSLIKI